jgi:hypothetical protein
MDGDELFAERVRQKGELVYVQSFKALKSDIQAEMAALMHF